MPSTVKLVRGERLEVRKKNNVKHRSPTKEGHTSTLDILKLRCVPDSSLDNDILPENNINKAIRKQENKEIRKTILISEKP
jgi:hypothetical protein